MDCLHGLLLGAVILGVVFHNWLYTKCCRHWQTLRFLRGVPEAASYYNTKMGDVCEVWLNGVRTLLVSDPEVAGQIFISYNYRSRFGDKAGLRNLGMFDKGVIWNMDHERWVQQRAIFEKAVNAKSLKKAAEVAESATLRKVAEFSNNPSPTTDMMMFFRYITLIITLEVMIGVDAESCDCKELVESIIDYFKAWEFFLLKPRWLQACLFRTTLAHRKAVARLNTAVAELIKLKRSRLDAGVSTDDFFFHQLIEGQIPADQIQQSVLEMLIAGTDTSSVSMFYSLLLLAEHGEVQDEVYGEVRGSVGIEDLPQLVAVLQEGMRVKPVGPVSLRRAAERHELIEFENDENGRSQKKVWVVNPNDNVIINLARMHQREKWFDEPARFNPGRFLADKEKMTKVFMPFGKGPKGCVGQFLAMKEMKVVMTQLIRRFSFRIVADQTLRNTPTHWDIAQQPVNVVPLLVLPRAPRHLLFLGPSSTGKTTLAKQLSQTLNIPIMPETARTIMQRLNITAKDIKEDENKCLLLQKEIMKAQNNAEKELCGKWCVGDRTCVDAMIFAKTYTNEVRALEELECWKDSVSRYRNSSASCLFVVKPFRECLCEDGVRILEDWDTIQKTYEVFIKYLRLWKVPFTVIDVLDRAERLNIVLKACYETTRKLSPGDVDGQSLPSQN